MGYFDIHGVLPPLITPFSESGSVDFEAFGRNIERMNDTGLCGYLVLGSNGETPYIDEKDKIELVRLCAKKAAPGWGWLFRQRSFACTAARCPLSAR